MFEFIRTHQRLMQLILLILILPSFAFFGLQSYQGLKDDASDVAKVGGQTIKQSEFDVAQRNQAQRMQQQMGANFDAKLLDTPEAKAEILNTLITERVTLNEVTRDHLNVSNASVLSAIGEIPAVRALFDKDGKIDEERYKLLLSGQNLTHDQLVADVRRSLLLKQVVSPVQDTAMVSKTLENRLVAILGQEREVAEHLVKLSDYQAQAKLSADAVQKYYDTNPKEFEVPEKVKLDYLVLNGDALASQVMVPDDAVQEYYKQNQKRYQVEEQRRASHILIAVSKDAKPEDQQKAKTKAEEILAKVKANPADFAKLAKQYSDDPGSANNGGDLDYLGKGATVPPFEQALFALKENQISDLVQSDFGYHIILLTGVKPGAIKALETVRPEIESEIRKQLVAKKFAESAEAFANTVYEQADSLQPAADKFGLKIQTASDLARNPGPGADPKAPINNPKLLAAVFTDDVLKNKHNTAAIDLGANTLVAAHVADYKPASLRPLADVSEAIKAKLIKQETETLARQAGESQLAALLKSVVKADTKPDQFTAPITISRSGVPSLPAEAVPEIFKADVSKLPAYVGMTLSSGDYAIYRITKFGVLKPIDDAQRAMLTQSLARQYGDLETSSYLESLKKNAKVKYLGAYAELLNKKTAAASN